MFMYPFRKLSAQAGGSIGTVQFALAFQIASSGVESLLCGYGVEPQQS